MTAEPEREGWALPAFARKPHFFVGTKSLCGKHRHVGPLSQTPNDGHVCQVCRRYWIERQTP